MSKTFPLPVVLTATTMRLLCDYHDFKRLMDHITGDEIYDHQVPRALQFASPIILELFPELKNACTVDSLTSLRDWIEADRKTDKRDGFKLWIAEIRAAFPDIKSEYEIPSFSDSWLSIDPVQEANAIWPGKVAAVPAK